MFFPKTLLFVWKRVWTAAVWWKRLNSDQISPPPPIIPWKRRDAFAFSAMVLEWQKWGGTRGVFFLVCSDLCLDSCKFLQHLFQKKKKKKRELLACCYPGSYLPAALFRPPPAKVESSLISWSELQEALSVHSKKKKKKKSLILFLQPAVWNFIPLGFKDLSLFCIFQFFFLLCAWAIRWSSATKAKKYTHSYTYIYIYIYIHTYVYQNSSFTHFLGRGPPVEKRQPYIL